MTYPSDFRHKMLSVRQQGSLSIRKTAQRFCIGVATLTRWVKCPEIRRCLSRQRKLVKEAVLDDVKRHPDAYHYERAVRLGVDATTIGQALKKWGVTYKKNTSPSQSGQRRTACLPK